MTPGVEGHMRSDEQIRADVAERYAAGDFEHWQMIVDRLASDVPGLLARAVAAETEAANLRESAETLLFTVENVGASYRLEVERRETAQLHCSAAECERDALRAAALAGAAPEGDPPQPIDRSVAIEAVATALCPGTYCEAHSECRDDAERALAALDALGAEPVAAVVQAAPEQDTHHVEAIRNDFTPSWGWHCLTCNATAMGWPSIDAAEADGDRHAKEAATPEQDTQR
jgi:hypothetical protein